MRSRGLSRREFLGAALAAGAGALAAERGLAAPAPAARPRSAVHRVALGKSGLKASFLGVGTGTHGWMHSTDQTRIGRDAFVALIRHAYERGLTFLDVADLYGTHPFLREALRGIPRDKVVIQSKVWFQPEGLPEPARDARQAVERFLREVGVDYLDSVLLHCVHSGSWTADLRPLMDGLAEAKAKGLIRAHGVSCHTLPALRAAAVSGWTQVQLARINHRGVAMDGAPDQVAGLLKGMRASGKGVIGMKLFGEGRFRTAEARRASVHYAVEQGAVDSIIVGFSAREQVDDAIATVDAALAQAGPAGMAGPDVGA